MKNCLNTVAVIMALTAVSISLETVASTGISNDEPLQIQAQGQEMMSEIDVLDKNAVDSVAQSQSVATEMPSSSTSETFLEQVRANSRRQAAEATYKLSIIAANSKNLTLARTLIEEAIQLNQSNPNYLTFAADIAFITKEYDKAEKYQLMVLEMVRSVLGLDDLQVAGVLDQLAAIYAAQKRYKEAKASLQESLQLRENVLGDNHLLVAVSLNKLASLAVRQQHPGVAEPLLKRSLDIIREVSGPRHANSATMLANLADLYQSEARLEEAEVLYKEAIAIWVDSPGDLLRQAISQNSLGQLLLSQQRFDDARLQFEQVLSLLKQNYSQDHPYVQRAIKNLAALDAKRRKNIEKEHMYDELVRELSFYLPQYKMLAENIASPLPELRIRRF